MSDTFWGYLLAVCALLLFTTAIVVTKVASSRIDLTLGFLIAASVNVLFSGLVFVVQLGLRADTLEWNASAFWLFAGAGVFSTYLGRWFFYESVVRFGPAKASIFQVSSPLFTALMAWLLLGERLTPVVALGMLMTVSGLMLVSYKPGYFARRPSGAAGVAVDDASLPEARSSSVPLLLQSAMVLGVGSSLAYAIGNVLRGSAVRGWNEPVLGALVGAAFGLLLTVVFSADKRGLPGRLRSARRSGVWLYALIGVCTISAQVFMIASMRYIPLSVATVVTLCTPILVFPLSYLLFKNRDDITVNTLLGSGLTLLGIFLIVTR